MLSSRIHSLGLLGFGMALGATIVHADEINLEPKAPLRTYHAVSRSRRSKGQKARPAKKTNRLRLGRRVRRAHRRAA